MTAILGHPAAAPRPHTAYKHKVVLRGAVHDLARDATSREVLIDGPAGTGKSMGICLWLVSECMRHQGLRVLLGRKTRESMTQTIMVTLESVLDMLEIPRPAAARNNITQYRVGSSEIICQGFDDPERIKSSEYDLIYVNEATELTEDDWEIALSRLRHNRHPDRQQAIADCNPGPKQHWLMKRVRNERMTRYRSLHIDNPRYVLSDGTWTEDGRRYLQETLAGLTGIRRKRLLRGEWAGAEGLVYDVFSEKRHVVPAFELPATITHRVRALDFGYAAPTAVTWMALLPAGFEVPQFRAISRTTAIVYREYYQSFRSIQEVADDVRLASEGEEYVGRALIDPAAYNQTAASTRTIAQQYSEAGLPCRPWPRTSGAGGMNATVAMVRHALERDQLLLMDCCPNLIDEFQSWQFKKDRSGVLDPNERYENGNDHLLDCVRGWFMTRPLKALDDLDTAPDTDPLLAKMKSAESTRPGEPARPKREGAPIPDAPMTPWVNPAMEMI